MKRKLIITRREEKIVAALFEDDKLAEVRSEDEGGGSLLGNIYIGKVDGIASNIRAAFIDIGMERPCYFSMEESAAPVWHSRVSEKKPLCVGDELLVQVCREPLKTKSAAVSANLNFTGKYLVLTSGNAVLGVSSKLPADARKRLKSLLSPHMSGEFGLVARTNAGEAGDEEILKELALLREKFRKVRDAAPYRTAKSLLYRPPGGYLKALQDVYTDGMEAIVTDDKDIYREVSEYLSEYQPKDLSLLRLYEDKTFPLWALYGLGKKLEDALNPRVWMKSGAYLVIEPTEALTVIDVNTGRFSGKKKLRETYLKINLEAAREAAGQIRLRNLSGIIVIDFIDMEEIKDREKVMDELRYHLNRDPVQTVLVDMTALGLVEITRKKVRRPLADQLGKGGGTF